MDRGCNMDHEDFYSFRLSLPYLYHLLSSGLASCLKSKVTRYALVYVIIAELNK